MSPAALRILYVEADVDLTPVTWRSWGSAGDDPRMAGRDVHRVFGLLLGGAHYDRTNEHGRVLRVGRSLLAETVIDHSTPRPLKATLVVSGIGRTPSWAAQCADEAAAILRDHGLPAPAEHLQAALTQGWQESAPRRRSWWALIQRLLIWPRI